MKRRILNILKIVFPLAIMAWLASRISGETYDAVRQQEKNWPLLAASFALVMTAIGTTFVRWYLLVRALELPFRLRDAFRLGFLAFLLNFVSVGAVGGDLFKAVFIAHEQPGRRTRAVASVVVDRVAGLFALVLLTTTMVLLVEIPNPDPQVVLISRMTVICAGGAVIGLLSMLVAGYYGGPIARRLIRIPRIGPILGRALEAVAMYRRRPRTLCVAVLLGLVVHSLLAAGIYLAARATFTNTPTLAEHLIIVPLANVAGALPFTPAGLGTFEAALDYLYRHVSSVVTTDGQGFIAALIYRVMTIVVAAIGVVYYWFCRREVQEVLHEAEESG